MTVAPDPRQMAEHHAAEAERLLDAAGQSTFTFANPMLNTREQTLARAGVHAALANYYTSQIARDV